MQKVDLVIAGVGALALVATVLGVVFYEEVVGERTVAFPETSRDISDEGSLTVGAGSDTVTFPIPAPDNATRFEDMRVTVAFTGTAGVQPSGGSYTVRVTAPDGSSCTGGTQAWSSASQTIDVADCNWLEPPESTSTANVSAVNETVAWTRDLIVEVDIQNPSTTLPPVQGVHSYSYNVSVSAKLFTYAAQVEVPDPQGGQ